MRIDYAQFTPWASLAGGVLIGLAAALLIVLTGRIAGISGIIGGLLRPVKSDWTWRLAFIAGLIAAPVVVTIMGYKPEVRIDASWPALMIAGLLVGIGTRYGSGCTSGHGVCGISRLSPRSLIATLSFMAGGFITVYLMRHL